MIYKILCFVCKQEVISEYTNKKYCSKKCAGIAWIINNPNKYKELFRKNNKKRKNPNIENKLTLIKSTSKRDSSGNIIWKCNCSCGKIFYAAISKVKNNIVRSCGCLRKTKNPHLSAIKKIYQDYKYGAKVRNIDFCLNLQQVQKIIESDCFYCGEEPKEKQRTYKTKVNGIDRKNNHGPYTIKNCVPCCWICNSMKGKMSKKEFIDQCKLIKDNI